MGSTGAPWNIEYPDATDLPRLVSADLLDMANTMDSHVSTWEQQWNRLRRRPAAKLSYDSSVRYKINKTALSTVQYNNVLLDTAQMTDLQKRTDRIYLPYQPRPSLFLCGGTIIGLPVTLPGYPDIRLATNAQWSVNTTPTPSIRYGYDTRDMNAARTDTSRGETFQVSALVLNYGNLDGNISTPGLSDIWVQLEINSGVEFTVWQADLWAFWATDIASIPSF